MKQRKTKNTVIVKNKNLINEEISSIRLYGPMTVMCDSELIVTDQEEFLSNFPNGIFDKDIFEHILSRVGEIDGTYISNQEIDHMELNEYNMELTDLKIVCKE
jgi:hypothetical protein